MSLFLETLDRFQWLIKKADVKGEPRISITFDNDADSARFIAELNRDINNVIAVSPDRIAKYTEFRAYGIKVRII